MNEEFKSNENDEMTLEEMQRELDEDYKRYTEIESVGSAAADTRPPLWWIK